MVHPLEDFLIDLKYLLDIPPLCNRNIIEEGLQFIGCPSHSPKDEAPSSLLYSYHPKRFSRTTLWVVLIVGPYLSKT